MTDALQEETTPKILAHIRDGATLADFQAGREYEPEIAGAWDRTARRLRDHASAIEALAVAVKGCGKEIGSVFVYNCGESLDDSKEPPHCPACNDAQWFAIRALLVGKPISTLSEIRGAS